MSNSDNVKSPGIGDRLSTQWETAKPWVFGLVIGLVAGPVISGMTGFQVRSSTAEAATQTELVAQQADYCANNARAGSTLTTPLDWQQRSDLAKQFALAPDGTAAESAVVYACSSQLAR